MTIENFLPRFADRGYALLRMVAGAMFLCHGLQKVFGAFGGEQAPAGSQLWIGGLIELACGAAIALGLLTSLAAFLASGEMAVAYIQFHWQLRFDSGFLPIVNLGELALLYSFVFLYVACRGDGMWALGDVLRRRSGLAAGSSTLRAGGR